MTYNLYFSNGQRPAKITPSEIPEWCYSDHEEETVKQLLPRETFTNQHGDKWERVR